MATTMYMSGISLIVQYLTNLGLLAAGGSVQTYVGGSSSTPVTTYTDSTGTVPNPNPMTLNSAGRPASASGAPVAFWVPGGTTVRLYVYDAASNLLVYLDNVPALNDLTNASSGLQTLLASAASTNTSGVGPVAGADLVANAVKSYDIFADVRSANAPTLVSGQTLNIEIQGGLTVNDGLGGVFYWSPTSTATDDGRTVLKPTSIAGGAVGRWLRYYPLGVPLILVKPAAQQITSNTVLQNDTALFATLAAGGTYRIQLSLGLLGFTTTTQGWKVALAYSGAIGQGGAGGGVVSGNNTAVVTASALNATMSNAAISDGIPDVVVMDFIVVTASAGTLQVQFAQNSSSANAVQMNQGSAVFIERIA